MPVVPRVSGRRVASAPAPNTRLGGGVPDAAFGVHVPIDLSGPQQLLTAIAQEERQKADEVAVLEADAELGSFVTSLLSDPQSGVLNRRGLDAFGAADEARDAFRKRAGEIEARLHGERQRLAYRRRRLAREADLETATLRHESAEGARHDDQTTQAYIANARQEALLFADDPERLELSIAQRIAAIRDHARRRGIAPEVVTEAVNAERSWTRAMVLQRMLNQGRDLDAKAYFEQFRDELVGDDLLNAEKAIAVGSRLGEAQRHRDRIMSMEGVTYETAQAEARKITDPYLRAETEKEIDAAFRRREQAERERDEALEAEASTYVERGLRPPAGLWSQLKPDVRRSLDAWRRQVASGENIVTDWRTYYGLLRGASDTARWSEFADLDLMEARGRLADPEWKELVRIQMEIRESLAKGTPVATRGILTDNQVMEGAIGRSEYFQGLPDKSVADRAEKERRLELFRRDVDREMREYRIVHGLENSQPVPTVEVQKIVDRLSLDIFFREWGKDPSMALGAMTAEERRQLRGRAYVPLADIPEDDREFIRSLFSRVGLTSRTRDLEGIFARLQLDGRSLDEILLRGDDEAFVGIVLGDDPDDAAREQVLEAAARFRSWVEARRAEQASAGSGPVEEDRNGHPRVPIDTIPPVARNTVARTLSGGGRYAVYAEDVEKVYAAVRLGDQPLYNALLDQAPREPEPRTGPLPMLFAENVADIGFGIGTMIADRITGRERPAAAVPSAPLTVPSDDDEADEAEAEPPVYTAANALDAVVALRESRGAPIRIPAETDDLDAREAVLREILRYRHSLGSVEDVIVRRAEQYLSRIDSIRAGRIAPSDMRQTLGRGL